MKRRRSVSSSGGNSAGSYTIDTYLTSGTIIGAGQELAMKLIEKSELGPLVSPKGNQYVPIHNWYPYKHGYSKGLADYLIEHFHLSAGDWVLDPFCGGGTTLLTCKELGVNAHGFDILPFSVFLSNVKVGSYDSKVLEKELNTLKMNDANDYCYAASLPDIPIVKKAFKPDIEKALITLKSRIDYIHETNTRNFFNLAFLSILESVSNTSKTGGFLRITNRQVHPDEIMELFLSKSESMIQDIVEFNKNKKRPEVSTLAKIGDARKLPTRRTFDAVITSPPYPNRHDYTRIYSLEMMFDFVSNNDQLKQIRYKTIRSHVEARKKYEAAGYKKPDNLASSISQVIRNGTNNPQVIAMLEGYFEDMYLALSEMHKCLKNGGQVAMVVSNVRYAGVNILVDEILSEIGMQVGLIPTEIWAIRNRGNSSQQMRDYTRNPSRESVIFWGKNA